jgi:hypothetical protein
MDTRRWTSVGLLKCCSLFHKPKEPVLCRKGSPGRKTSWRLPRERMTLTSCRFVRMEGYILYSTVELVGRGSRRLRARLQRQKLVLVANRNAAEGRGMTKDVTFQPAGGPD